MMKILKSLILSLALFAFPVMSQGLSFEERFERVTITQGIEKSVPKNFLYHYKTFAYAIDSTWKDVPYPDALAGLVEQETCYSLTHSKCWSVHAELKTSREYGFGLGQLTVTSRFNAWEEAKGLDKRLKSWNWEDRFNPEYQMISVVSMTKRNYNVFKEVPDPYQRMAFTFASYNGGIGGIRADQRVCRSTPNCNQNIWFGNVEHTSLKAKTVASGYGKSFFEINREHSRNILTKRRFKYVPFLDPIFKEE